MEQEPKQDRKILSYEEALALAESDIDGWKEAQLWALDNYLIGRAEDQLDQQARESFQREYRELESHSTIENLTTLGNKYNLLPDFDLQTESLKSYCRKNNIKLSSGL